MNNAFEFKEQIAGGCWARAHLWWDELTDGDCTVHSTRFTPAADALACLARWRMGKTRKDDVSSMQNFYNQRPDARPEGRLALAAAQMGLHHPDKALSTLEHLEKVLELDSRNDFNARQDLDLCRAMHAKALMQAGRKDKARAEASGLLKTLKPGLLPAHLCNEVIVSSGRFSYKKTGP